MSGQRVLGHLKQAGEVACGEPVRLMADQGPESLQTGRLREGGKRHDGLFDFHISRLMEI